VSELREALGHHEQLRLEEYWEAVDVEVNDLLAVNLEVVNLEVVDQEACAMKLRLYSLVKW
jgi:hypothetical protein